MDSYGDHRLGMMAAIASLITAEPITIEDPACIDISYPTFFEDLEIARHVNSIISDGHYDSYVYIVKEQVKIWDSYKKLNDLFKKAMLRHLANCSID